MQTPIIIYTEKDGKEQSFLFTLNEDGSNTLQLAEGETTKNFTILGGGTLPIINMVIQSGSVIQVKANTDNITDAKQCNMDIVSSTDRIPLGTIEQDLPLNIGDIIVIFNRMILPEPLRTFEAKEYVGTIVAIDAR